VYVFVKLSSLVEFVSREHNGKEFQGQAQKKIVGHANIVLL